MCLGLQSISVCMKEELSHSPGCGPHGLTTIGHMEAKPAHRGLDSLGYVGQSQNLQLSCGAWEQGMAQRPEQGWLSQSSTSYCTPPKPAPHLKYGAPCPGQNCAGAGWLDMELHRSQAPHVCLQGSSSLLSVPGLTQPCLVLRTISPTTLRVCWGTDNPALC